jgi:hypothetical protein
MKKEYKPTLNERDEILNLHKKATSRHYLKEQIDVSPEMNNKGYQGVSRDNVTDEDLRNLFVLMGDQYDLTDDYLPNGTTNFETDGDSCKMHFWKDEEHKNKDKVITMGKDKLKVLNHLLKGLNKLESETLKNNVLSYFFNNV